MANPQPQSTPPQPVYPRDLNYALDRVHTRFVEYANAKDDALAAQMRVGFAESYNRDEGLHRRVENLENGMQALANTVLSLVERISNIENTQRETQALIRDLHAQTMEAINDLRPKNIE
ncbi:MAG: hypothetical protein H0X24_17135 [Ktedonobacterales bacterium]|nr:hypothetical protein [Ktedonobacterales bacterium]